MKRLYFLILITLELTGIPAMAEEHERREERYKCDPSLFFGIVCHERYDWRR